MMQIDSLHNHDENCDDEIKNHDDEIENDYAHVKRYTYCLKIFNPEKRSKYAVQKLRKYDKFRSPKELRECLLAEFNNQICDDNDEFEVGFNKGRHGAAKIWIKDNEDLERMYDMYGMDEEIILWCEGICSPSEQAPDRPRQKRGPNRDNTCTPTSKQQAIQDEVDDIVAQLQEKHGSQYLPVQYRLWANMLQIGTHRDYSVPPNVPMFGAGKSSKATAGTSISEALSSVAEGIM